MDYVARLASLVAERSQRVARTKALIEKYGPLLERYHGGMPVGVLAAIMQLESDGKMDSPGDVGLGEVGLFQVTSSFPKEVKVDPSLRYQPEGNVFLGALEYQIEAAKMARQFPQVVTGSEDQWKLARLAFAIGSYGARTCTQLALAQPGSGSVYDRVRAWADRTGGMQLGSQSPAKIWYRIHVVDETFAVGQAAKRGWYGAPQTIPAPPGVLYQFPAALVPFTSKPIGAAVAILGGVAAAAYILSRLL